MLRISLLGAPQVALDDTSIFQNTSNKGRALFYYLACVRTEFTRQEVAAVLWPDLPERSARHNLRTALSELRQEVADHLTITHSTVAFIAANYWLDIEEFEQTLKFQRANAETAALQAACDLYQGEFLQGVSVRNATAFEEWLLLKRTEYHLLAVEGLTSLAQSFIAQQALDAAADATSRLLALDSWSEVGHQNHMLILAQRGARGAALSHYAHICTMLANEYGMEPTAETTKLYHRIRKGEIGGASTSVFPLAARSTAPTYASSPASSLHEAWRSGKAYGAKALTEQSIVGRTTELAEIEKRLCFSQKRLVTLTGLKGVGKSRLAVAAGRLLSQRSIYSAVSFAADLHSGATLQMEPWQPRDGVYFASLPVESDGISPTMQQIAIEITLAHALHITHQPHSHLHQQLLNHLAGRQILLILNQVIPTPIQRQLIGALLEAAPHMRILAASSHPLRLADESNLEVVGLKVRAPGSGQVREQDAVQFFLQQRKMRHSDWMADADDMENIVRICTAVDGLPLGIELAASLSETIALDALANILTDDSHQGAPTEPAYRTSESWPRLRILLEHHWSRLNESEQMALRRLTVFSGSVSRRAAQEISMTPKLLLENLLAKGLLSEQHERLFMPESVRRYADRQRPAQPDLVAETVQRFSSYYANLVANAAFGAIPLSQESVDTLMGEWANLLLAWRWATQNPQHATAPRMGSGMRQLLAWYGYEVHERVMG